MPISRLFVTACLAGACLGSAAARAGAASPRAQEAPAPIAVQRIGGGLYLVTGGSGANAGFYVTSKEVCVIDAKMAPDSARQMLAEIRKITKAPATTLILTHSDGDHVNGLPGFPEGFVIVAHENVKRDLEKAAAEIPALKKYLPRVTYTGDSAFDIGGTLLPLRHFGPAHTDGDTTVVFEKEKAAFVGDLAFQGRDPLIHLKKNGSAEGLVRTLRGLLEIRPAIEIFLVGPRGTSRPRGHRIPGGRDRGEGGQGESPGRGGQDARRRESRVRRHGGAGRGRAAALAEPRRSHLSGIDEEEIAGRPRPAPGRGLGFFRKAEFMKRNPLSPVFSLVLAAALAAAACGPAGNPGEATVVERRETVRTYPFSDPDPVPIFARSSMGGQGTRLYPYSFFDGFAARPEDRDWTVVRLENPHLSVAVLPEVGGKVWGAAEKTTGREFLYTNHVLKFRQIALRGPWTSGGIEFNFGIVGHAPTTATPVDFLTRRNPDGSASVVVGAIDLPSRTRWSVTVTLPRDAAHFETNARWANPTPFDQAYYAWSCAAIRTADDLRYIFPGRHFIGHDYAVPFEPWPVDREGRDLSVYRNNASPGSKSYFTVGEVDDFYGAWYETSDSGFGHWARPDEVPGRKVWIWDLSRQGGIWVDLLTDKDGQYTEPQAGRLYNQSDHESFPPGRADTWQELWFPYRDIGPMVKASPWAVLGAKPADGKQTLGLFALKPLDEEVVVTAGGREILREKIALGTGKTWTRDVGLAAGTPFRVAVGDKLAYDSDPASRRLERPLKFRTDEERTTEGLFLSATRLERERQYGAALEKFEGVVSREPLHVRALSRLAGLRARRGEDEKALEIAGRALSAAMYDPGANYIYGVAARRLGRLVDAREAFGWAARSGEFRTAALTQLAEIGLQEKDLATAIEYARKAAAAGPEHSAAWEVLAAALRRAGRGTEAEAACRSVLGFDALDHLARFEIYLAGPTAEKLAAFKAPIRGELPHETYLEMAMFYVRNGLFEDALTLLRNAPEHPEVSLWTAYLLKDGSPEESRAALDRAFALSPRLVFPFREESIPVYRWAMDRRPDDWKPRYYLGLIFWGKGRMEEAEELFARSDEADFGPFFMARGALRETKDPAGSRADFERAVALDGADWRARHALVNFHLRRSAAADALAAARAAVERFPDNGPLRVDLVKSLMASGLYGEAAGIMDGIEALPYEGASEIHGLFVQTRIRLALEKIRARDFTAAVVDLDRSKEYPERLGTGAPFDPDVRLQDALAALCFDKLGDRTAAEARRKAVIDFTERTWPEPGQHAYFGALALRERGEKEKADKLLAQGQPAKEIMDVLRLLGR